ncbi:hypothetical protein [Alloacidobacterium sp.]|uniref:hypothetical protein n=1 Tax=Alloacidobacterium sp. TaxID=2951999 RepID=UPI002D695DEF|nr:hypothetical protein [Alloacidobacterium sp.]HYK34705.1 hypothetical protein [Alloacidobacterium sp.]
MNVLPPSTPGVAVYLWERQPDESAKAFHAFCLYRDAGIQRSLTQVAQMLHVSKQAVGRWSRQHRWVRRALEWDNYEAARINEQTLQQQVQLRARMMQRLLARMEAMTEDEARSMSVFEFCALARTMQQGINGGGEHLAHFPTGLPQPEFRTRFYIDVIPERGEGFYYFRVEDEEGQPGIIGRVRSDEAAQNSLLEAHPTAIIVK